MIKPDDVDRFFKNRKISTVCTSCNQSNWSIANGPDEHTLWSLASVRDDGSTFMPAPSVPLLVLVCSNCFAVRMHAHIAVARWLEENPAKGVEK